MSFYNGQLNFDHKNSGGRGPRGFPGIGFDLDGDGNYDMENKKLTNVKTPTSNADAATKKYIDDEIGKASTGHTANLGSYLKKDGSVPMTGDLDVGNHKITNVATPTTNTDSANKKYVDDSAALKVDTSQVQSTGDAEAGKLVKYLPDKGIITPKLYVPDQYNDSVILKADDQRFDDIPLHIPNLENYDGNANRRKSSVVVDSVDNTLTGKLILPSGHIIIKDGNNQVVINRADIDKLFGTQGNQNGIIANKCALYDGNGAIFANYYAVKVGSNFVFLRGRNQSAWRSLFIPNLGGGDATMIIDQTNQTINGDKTFSRAITMTQQGSASNHLVTKAYVDNHSTNGNYLKTDGTNSMTGDLNMGNHKIVSVDDPSVDTDVTTKKYVDSKTKINPSHSLKNTFKYVMDDINEISTEYGLTADKIDVLGWSPHSNKKVLYFRATKDGLNNYRYRLGIQMSRASTTANTVAIEQLFTSENYWNKAQIIINGAAIAIESHHTTKFSFTVGNTKYYYTKTIVQLKKIGGVSHYLYYTTHIDNVSPSSAARKPLHALVYGIDSFLSDVDSSVYNLTPFEIGTDDKMKMLIDLDMNNHSIVNVSDPTNNTDAVNKLYSDTISFHGENGFYWDTFPDFYDLLKTSQYNIIHSDPSNPNYSNAHINKINPNLFLGTNRGISDYWENYGLKLSAKTYINFTDTFDQSSSFTFFISFRHDTTKTCELSWMIGSGSNLTKSYPRYKITNNNIEIDGNTAGLHAIRFPSRYQNKKLCLWICYDGSRNLHKMRLVNLSSLDRTFNPPMNFQSTQLEIDFDVYVNKIGFTKQFIDVDSLDFYRIMLEEKRNGSFVV